MRVRHTLQEKFLAVVLTVEESQMGGVYCSRTVLDTFVNHREVCENNCQIKALSSVGYCISTPPGEPHLWPVLSPGFWWGVSSVEFRFQIPLFQLLEPENLNLCKGRVDIGGTVKWQPECDRMRMRTFFFYPELSFPGRPSSQAECEFCILR